MSAIVLGSGPQALYVLRQLARSGKVVKLLAFEEKIAFSSKYGTKETAKDAKELITKLQAYASEYKEVHICGGKELQAIVDFGLSLFSIYDIYPKSYELLSIFSKKHTTYQYFSKIALLYPECYSFDEILSSSNLPGPLIVKWNQDVLGCDYLPHFKTKIFFNFVDFEIFYGNLDKGILNYLIIQDYIAGAESSNISLQISINKHNFSFLTTRKSRVSKNGFGSYVYEFEPDTEFVQQILHPVLNVLMEDNYVGLIELEFKQCEISSRYFLIEANSRACGLLSAFGAKYRGDVGLIYGSADESKRIDKNVNWTSFFRDLQSCIIGLKKDRSLSRFLSNLYTITQCNSFDIFDIKDIKPFFKQVIK